MAVKERIKLVSRLKAAQDEATKIQNRIIKAHGTMGGIFDDINKLIERVDNLDREVEEEEKSAKSARHRKKKSNV